MSETRIIQKGKRLSIGYSSSELKYSVDHYLHFNYFKDNLNTGSLRAFPREKAVLYSHVGNNKLLIKQNKKERCLKHFIIGPLDQTSQVYIKPICDDLNYQGIIIPIRLTSLFKFISPPLCNVKNSVLDIEEIWGETAKYLKKQLELSTDIDRNTELLDLFLMNKLKNISKKSVSFIERIDSYIKEGNLSVDDLVRCSNVSYRTIHRFFTRNFGIGPKEYLKLIRFNRVCCLLKNKSFNDWTEIAFKCGYYDQSHFIHDFKTFMKISPEEFADKLNSRQYDSHPASFNF